MQRLLQILFWSIISAAFIGPGTVTTAASSGVNFGFSLMWALLFSTVACLVLQEASARLTVVSGKSLAQAIRQRFSGGATGLLVLLLVSGAILLGCAAYEAGNILGGVAGAALGIPMSPKLLTVAIGLLAGLLLYFGSTTMVARLLGIVVALMGITFLVTAIRVAPPVGELLKGTLVPALPDGAGLLVLGLIGTTVVPYNLFLGSGIAAGQKPGDVRFGLTVAIVLGGLISMAVLVVGTSVSGEFSFEALARSLETRLGGWAAGFFAFGLFAAGLSSAITAPLAAAVTARGLFGERDSSRWTEKSLPWRLVWFLVLATGVVFGLADVKPVPAIIVAQALNGVLLPFVAVFLILVVNDRQLMGDRGINGLLSNAAMALVTVVTIILGVTRTAQAITSTLDLPRLPQGTMLAASAVVAAILILPVVRKIRQYRR